METSKLRTSTIVERFSLKFFFISFFYILFFNSKRLVSYLFINIIEVGKSFVFLFFLFAKIRN